MQLLVCTLFHQFNINSCYIKLMLQHYYFDIKAGVIILYDRALCG